MAVGAGGGDPKLMIALAFRELAENAAKIGELNITPDLLQSLIRRRTGEAIVASLREDGARHPQDAARGADRALQHPGTGEVLHRARRRRLRRLPARGRRVPALPRRAAPRLEFGLPRQIDRPESGADVSLHAPRPGGGAGQDGLVANMAKYAGAQPIVGVNPDPERFDGVLLPFRPDERAPRSAGARGQAAVREVTLARAAARRRPAAARVQRPVHRGADPRVRALSDCARRRREAQSSSGVLVSTGAGSTGWLSSVFNMAAGVRHSPAAAARPMRLRWEDPRLVFVVREPFVSRHSAASIVAG